MFKTLGSALLLISGTTALGPSPNSIKNLVTFGDSYTDIVSVGDGGTAWPVYLAGYANLTLFPFAKSGAVCNQSLTPRPAFPAVVQDELPAYFDAVSAGNVTGSAHDTLYTLWIGKSRSCSSCLLVPTYVDFCPLYAQARMMSAQIPCMHFLLGFQALLKLIPLLFL